MTEALSELSGDINDIEYIFSPLTIRKKSQEIYNLTIQDKTNFIVHLEKLDEVAKFVVDVTLSNYPKLNIPFHSRWNHFQVDRVNRLAELNNVLEKLSLIQRIRAKLDLVVISVLLDAGAGMRWKYLEQKTNKEYTRSEGLAVASFRAFMSGFFSADKNNPYQVNSERLKNLTEDDLEKIFQVSEKNPLIGVEGRLKLLQNLGQVLRNESEFFGTENPRIGNIIDYFQEKCPSGNVTGTFILRTLQKSLGSIWPGRVTINNINLGDVWPYPPLGGGVDNLIPFHKLSQWLAYSLCEPLTESGLTVSHLDELTGLAEYRNGGLMLDSGLIELRDKTLLEKTHSVGSELIVEWRALTISFLDEISKKVLFFLNKKPSEFPLARVLEGGTWWAGRQMAFQLRKDGSSPIKLQSDGTVF